MSSIIFNIRKALNMDRKKWPVDVYKFERRGENWVLSKDRGRRVKNPETGDFEYQFLKEDETTSSISYEHLSTDKNGVDTLFLAKPEKGAFFPLNPEFEVNEDNEDDEETPNNVDMKWVMEFSNFIQAGKKELDRSYKIVQTDEKNWYEDPMVQAVAAFVGFGIFMVLAGIGYSKMIQEGTMAAVAELTRQVEALKGFIPLLALKLRGGE